ncbi:thiamine phosphate synthase, partial [Burkholderia pseudomallei]
ALASRAPLADDWIAALAAFLDCGFAASDALVLALAWRDGDEARGGDPWPVDPARFPRVLGLPAAPEPAFAPCPQRLGLYPVLPSAEWVERVLDCGVRTVQLRVKDASPDALRAEIERAVAAGRRHPDARVFINDHWRLALDAGAYGVHLGQEDLETADLGAIARAGARLGLSSHGYYEMLVALQFKPSYLALGPVFATATKAVAAPPQGLARLARYVRFAGPQAPLVAIGGIAPDTLGAVLAAGVGSAAVVSAITAAADYQEAIVALQQNFGR